MSYLSEAILLVSIGLMGGLLIGMIFFIVALRELKSIIVRRMDEHMDA